MESRSYSVVLQQGVVTQRPSGPAQDTPSDVRAGTQRPKWTQLPLYLYLKLRLCEPQEASDLGVVGDHTNNSPRGRCVWMRSEHLRRTIEDMFFSPPRYRMNVPLRNSRHFRHAWKCGPPSCFLPADYRT
ncbi:hypothetical protein MRX96_003297 [Rhipicephalus microplus]